MDIVETRHASVRRQQRAIPAFVVGLLMDQGACMRHQGAEVYYADKAARRRIRRSLGCRIHAIVETYLDAYVVCGDDGHVVTTAWRTQRLRKP
ncbi:hypothetical protein ACLF3G_26745 [Falsiroseomonas sp. HC035]|uniref:hypothetical protein n=1 Tax=Falsiroseomonas sp. HC035 TaxID=3390999 RepID=UPI003D322A3E